MTLKEIRKWVARCPHNIRRRETMHLKVLGELAKRDPDMAVAFVQVFFETCIRFSVRPFHVLSDLKNYHSVEPARRELFVWLHEQGVGYNVAAALLGCRSHSTAVLAVRRHYAKQRMDREPRGIC